MQVTSVNQTNGRRGSTMSTFTRRSVESAYDVPMDEIPDAINEEQEPEKEGTGRYNPNDSVIHEAIPSLPVRSAVVCLTMNVIFPGSGEHSSLKRFSLLFSSLFRLRAGSISLVFNFKQRQCWSSMLLFVPRQFNVRQAVISVFKSRLQVRESWWCTNFKQIEAYSFTPKLGSINVSRP